MNRQYASILTVLLLGVAPPASAAMPPMPGLTNGDGTVANNGMKHAAISLADTTLAVHIDTPPATPVTMMSGVGTDYTPDKFDVLEDVYFNAQYGWVPSGLFSPPAGAGIWIKRTGVTQPAGAMLRVYEGGNMTEGMAAWTMNEIYTSDGFAWQWDGAMQHDYYVADRVGDYSMLFEVYVGDASGAPLDGYTPAMTTFEFRAVPEPSTWLLAAVGVVSVVGIVRWRR